MMRLSIWLCMCLCHGFHAFVYVQVVEFQKQGLSHAHIFMILACEDKVETAEEIDSVVCAELPDSAVNPRLHAALCGMMLHGPCGAHTHGATCMENGKCTKGYPKHFQ